MSRTFTTAAPRPLDFTVDTETCVQCGQCELDCPYSIISLDDEWPTLVAEESCIRCLHCFAVCPTGSLSILGIDPKIATPLAANLPDKDQVSALLRGRRSTRQYAEEELPRETIDELLQTVWYAPTGVNSQQLLLSVIDNRRTLSSFAAQVYDRITEGIADPEMKEKPEIEYLARALQMRNESGLDIIFRGAPHLLVTSAPAESPSPMQDTIISLSYCDIMASAMGLGTLWNGMLKWALTLFPDLREKMGIPDHHVLGYCMLFGRPAVKYHRTVVRGPARVNRVEIDTYSFSAEGGKGKT